MNNIYMGLDSLQSGFKYKVPFDPPQNSRWQAELLCRFDTRNLVNRAAETHLVSWFPVWFYFFLYLLGNNLYLFCSFPWFLK